MEYGALLIEKSNRRKEGREEEREEGRTEGRKGRSKEGKKEKGLKVPAFGCDRITPLRRVGTSRFHKQLDYFAILFGHQRHGMASPQTPRDHATSRRTPSLVLIRLGVLIY